MRNKTDFKKYYGDEPICYTCRNDLSQKSSVSYSRISTPVERNQSHRYFYFDIDLDNRTFFEDYLIRCLLSSGYNITTDEKEASFFLGYGNSTFRHLTERKNKRAVSFSTYIYLPLTLGIDGQKIAREPLKKQLLKRCDQSDLNGIDRIETDVLILHGQFETAHPLLQATFLFSSLKDRKPDLDTKLCVVPSADESLYDHPSEELLHNIAESIVEFFNDGKDKQ